MAKNKMKVSVSTDGKNFKELSNSGFDKLFNKDPEGTGEALKGRRPYKILEANLKDGACEYVYEQMEGISSGEKHKVTGTGLYEQSLVAAFNSFNIHLACIDDAYKNAQIEFSHLIEMSNNELTFLYHVTGFKMKGGIENESVVLTGTKYVSCGGRINIETPKIYLDNAASYKWVEELAALVDKARFEVEEYKEGNFTPVEIKEEPKKKMKQTKLQFVAPLNEDGSEQVPETDNEDQDEDLVLDGEIDDEFESGKL